MPRLNNLNKYKEHRQQLRTKGTSAEATLWLGLQKRQLKGRKFRRQHSIGPFIVDFYCPKEKLAIELDGEVHNDLVRADYHYRREQYLTSLGIRVIRFENKAVFESPEEVLEAISSCFLDD